MGTVDNMNTVGTVTDATFRALMSGYPGGVVIVTAVGADGVPMGLTCSSMSSVSIAPPLLLICIANYSRTLSALRATDVFAVNMLHEGGRRAAQAFASAEA